MPRPHKPIDFYAEQAERLREKFRPKILLSVRDVAEVLGYASTAAALHSLHNLVRLGFVVEEWHGEVKKYYLNME